MAVHLSGAIKQPLKLSIEQAIERLKQGGVVAIPTETVYGLAAESRSAHFYNKGQAR